MPSFNIIKETMPNTSFRTARVMGMFDIPSNEKRIFHIKGEIDLNTQWNIGLIYGSSGSGKSSIAKEIFSANIINGYEWDNKSIVDNFNQELSPDDIINSLTSVGLSSPPAWLLPFHSLSNGQQFRANLARAIAENEIIVFDEFTSVVDRTVAKATCVALKKYITRTNKKFVAVSCHSDIIEWLQPDWLFNTNTCEYSRECLRRPQIKLFITKGHTKQWKLFHKHHYMNAEINNSAQVYLCYIQLDEKIELAGFFSTLPAMGMKGWRRGHRTVILPDYQGLGIGNKMIELVAERLYNDQGLRFRATTSAPQLVQYRLKRPNIWRLAQSPKNVAASGSKRVTTSAGRLTTSWEYIPEKLRKK